MMEMGDESIMFKIPMTTEGMCTYLQEHFGKPLALRKEGTTSYKCPYCQRQHNSEKGVGHFLVECEDESRYNGIGITIGGRCFTAGYGVKIVEYKEDNGINKLIV